MYIAKAGINIFKQVWKVLSFSCRQKYPLNRSAFIYCEDNVPSRLDLGKEQYGGPFTSSKCRGEYAKFTAEQQVNIACYA